MDGKQAVHRPGGTGLLEQIMSTTTTALKAEIAGIDNLIASMESSDPLLGCWTARREWAGEKLAAAEKAAADIVNEYLASHKVKVKFWPSQAVSYLGTKARVLKVARNGIWITRWPTEGEVMMRNLEIVKERVPARYLTPLAS